MMGTHVIDLLKVTRPSEWPKQRTKIESKVLSVLGALPKENIDLQVKIVDEESGPGYVRQKINYFVDEWSRISAWYFIPDDPDPSPAIICLHRAANQGKDEPAGLSGDPRLAFAQHYAQLGYVSIAPDSVTAGERVSSGLEPFDTATFYKDFPKTSLMAKMLGDHIKCIDVLGEAREVDTARIGVIGHDMGAYNALFLSAFDDRIRTCVSSCGITSFTEDKDPDRWARDSGLILLPNLRKAIQKDEYPFDWDELLSLIAPNPTLLIAAKNDEILSNASSCKNIVRQAKNVYSLLGEEGALEDFMHSHGHEMPIEALDAADDWFDRWL